MRTVTVAGEKEMAQAGNECIQLTEQSKFRAVSWGGDATKHFSVKRGVFSEKGGSNSVNGGFAKDFYRKSDSVKRSGPFSELPDSEK